MVFGFTYGTEIRWLSHAIAGIISLLLAIVVVLIGAMSAGRIKSMRGVNLVKPHRKLSIYLSLLILGTFFLGVWSRNVHGEPLFWQDVEPLAAFLQGWLGLLISIIAFSQVIPCLVVKDKRKTRGLHSILGYALVLLLIIQTVLGVQLIIAETAEIEVLTFPFKSVAIFFQT